MENTGKIVQVSGPVVDVEFENGELPAIKDALYVMNNGKKMCDGSIPAYRTQCCPLYHAGSIRRSVQGHGGCRNR